MGEQKRLKAKALSKHETEAHWLLSNYVPEEGEIVIYDSEVDANGNTLDEAYVKEQGKEPFLPNNRNKPFDYARQKIGNGSSNVNQLPFSGTNLPLSESEGRLSLAQGENSSFAEYGTALGYNTISGSKGYRISAFTPGETDEAGNYINGTYTLVLDEGEDIPQEIIGSTYCIYLKQSKDSVGTVSEINGNVITVDGFLYPAKWDEGVWEELDENGNKTGNTLSGEEWEAAKAEAFASSYIIFEGLPTIGNVNVGTGAHAEGWGNIASQIGSHAEGAESKALGKYSHAEGDGTVAYYSAHSEGKLTQAIGYHSHAEGYQTRAEGMDSHAEGRTTKAIGQDSHAEGLSTEAEGKNSHAEGQTTIAKGTAAHAEGRSTKALGNYAHAEGYESEASELYSHTEGLRTKAKAAAAHAEGANSEATGARSHAEGLNTTASGANSHTEGSGAKASANNTHAEGNNTTASGDNSHAEGLDSISSGANSHSEGYGAKAIGNSSHAEGQNTTAYGHYSHVGGMNSTTGMLNADGSVVTNSGSYALAHGYQAHANHRGSFAFGRDIDTTNDFQTVVGAFNDTSVKNAAFIVGNGTKENDRKNSFVSYTDGRAAIGKNPTNDMDVATKQYVDNKDLALKNELIEYVDTNAGSPEEFIAYIDIDQETTQEEVQSLLDAVYGTAILVIKEDTWPSLELELSKNIKDVYFDCMGWGGYINLKGPGKYSDTIIHCEHLAITEFYVSDVKAVYNAQNIMWGNFTRCEIIVNCTGDTFTNCDYIYDAYLYGDTPDERYYSITNALVVSGVYMSVSDQECVANINNCQNVSNVRVDNYVQDESFRHQCNFSNCVSVSNTMIEYDAYAEFSGDHVDFSYSNCTFVDPLTAYGAPNHLEFEQQEEIVVVDMLTIDSDETLQSLINDVRGILVLDFKNEPWYTSGITIPDTISTLYLCNGNYATLSIQNTNKDSHTQVIAYNSYFSGVELYNFNYVEGFAGESVRVYDCKSVNDVAGDEFKNCDELLNCSLYLCGAWGNELLIDNCKTVTNLKVMPNWDWEESYVNIRNCEHIHNMCICNAQYEGSNALSYLVITNCRYISGVYTEVLNDGLELIAQYSNCEHVLDAFGYNSGQDSEVTQEDIAAINSSITALNNRLNLSHPEADNTGNDISGVGWYTIAASPKGVNTCSSLFKIKAKTTTSGYWMSAIFTAEACFTGEPKLTILSHQLRGENFIDKIRILYNPNTYNGQLAYIQIHVNNVRTVQLVVDMLGDDRDDSPSWRQGWQLSISKEATTSTSGLSTVEKNLKQFALSNLNLMNQERVSALPENPDENTIYFIV